MTQTKKTRIIRKKGEGLGTDSNTMTEPYFAGEYQTKKEWDDKVKFLTDFKYDLKDITQKQKNLIIKTVKEFEEYRSGYWFKYREHDCHVVLDDRGKWRIFTKALENEAMPFDVDDGYYGDYCYNDSGFSFDKFPLRLWNYGDKIGLDDFIGVNVLSSYSWNDYFRMDSEYCYKLKWSGKAKSRIKILKRESMIRLCKYLVDCIIDFQKNNRFVNTGLKNEAEGSLSAIQQKVSETFKEMNKDGLVLLVKKINKLRSDLN